MFAKCGAARRAKRAQTFRFPTALEIHICAYKKKPCKRRTTDGLGAGTITSDVQIVQIVRFVPLSSLSGGGRLPSSSQSKFLNTACSKWTILPVILLQPKRKAQDMVCVDVKRPPTCKVHGTRSRRSLKHTDPRSPSGLSGSGRDFEACTQARGDASQQ